ALRQLADGGAAVAQVAGLVVAVERERDRAARAILPGRRLERAPGPHVVDDAAPLRLGPLPGFGGGGAGVVHDGASCLTSHVLRACMRRAMSRAATASWATKRAKSSGLDPTARRPSASNALSMSGSCRARAIRRCSCAAICGGAPAGSQAPNQLTTLKP